MEAMAADDGRLFEQKVEERKRKLILKLLEVSMNHRFYSDSEMREKDAEIERELERIHLDGEIFDYLTQYNLYSNYKNEIDYNHTSRKIKQYTQLSSGDQ